MYAFLHVSLLEEKTVTKPYPNRTNLVSFYFSRITLFNATRTNFIVSIVTELQRFLIRTRINVLQYCTNSYGVSWYSCLFIAENSVLLHKE